MPDQRGAPLSVVLTSADRHDKVSAVDLIVSMIRKRGGYDGNRVLGMDSHLQYPLI